jgi:hypothetical protein
MTRSEYAACLSLMARSEYAAKEKQGQRKFRREKCRSVRRVQERACSFEGKQAGKEDQQR